MPGLDAGAVTKNTGWGLNVVVGHNNAGKTRLLRALQDARFAATLQPSSIRLDPAIAGQNAQIRDVWPGLAVPIRITWPRNEVGVQDPGSRDPFVQIDAPSLERLRQANVHFNENSWRLVRIAIWPEIPHRPAMIVPTDRYGGQQHPLTSSVQLAVPEHWSAIMADLANSPDRDDREAFRRLSEAFTEVTDGLVLRPRQGQGQAALHIEESARAERPLQDCGDGLRDLVGILLYATRHPLHDLMIDEPGLRLHPYAQRKLLRYLEPKRGGVLSGLRATMAYSLVPLQPSGTLSTVTETMTRQAFGRWRAARRGDLRYWSWDGTLQTPSWRIGYCSVKASRIAWRTGEHCNGSQLRTPVGVASWCRASRATERSGRRISFELRRGSILFRG